MKWKTLMVTATLSTLLLSACGTDNANETAMRNQDNTLKNVNYNPNNNSGNPNQNNNDGTIMQITMLPTMQIEEIMVLKRTEQSYKKSQKI